MPNDPVSENGPRVIHIPADQVVEPPGIVRMRDALARGEHANPDADIPQQLYGPLSPEVVARFAKRQSNKPASS